MKPCLDGCLEKIKICISIYARKVMLYNHVKFKSQTPINLGGCKKTRYVQIVIRRNPSLNLIFYTSVNKLLNFGVKEKKTKYTLVHHHHPNIL
jgi:hypothetical protein